jgi:hypothetical protein
MLSTKKKLTYVINSHNSEGNGRLTTTNHKEIGTLFKNDFFFRFLTGVMERCLRVKLSKKLFELVKCAFYSKKVFVENSVFKSVVRYSIFRAKNHRCVALSAHSVLLAGLDSKELYKTLADASSTIFGDDPMTTAIRGGIVAIIYAFLGFGNIPYKVFKSLTMSRIDRKAIKMGNDALYNSMFKTVCVGVHFNHELNRFDTFKEVIKEDTIFDSLFRPLFNFVAGRLYYKVFNNSTNGDPNFSVNSLYKCISPID